MAQLTPWAALVGFVVAPVLSAWVQRRLGLTRRNFRGQMIPAATGLTLVIAAGCGYAALASWPYLAAVVTFGGLGFLDDWKGDRTVGGFRGHLGALVQGKVTTGAIKLLGGASAALWIAWTVSGVWQPMVLGDAALIALSANTVNLLDLRPGRARFAFALLLTPSAIVSVLRPTAGGGWLPLVTLGAALLEWRSDARGQGMLGDTGANLLGAVAGLAAVEGLPPLGRWAFLAALLLVNGVAERVSISATIERVGWLRAIDQRLGIR